MATKAPWTCSLVVRLLLRLLCLAVESGMVLLVVTGWHYCNPECQVETACWNIPIESWHDGMVLQYAALSCIALCLFLHFTLLLLVPICVPKWRHWSCCTPLLLCACLCATTGAIEFYYSGCPWDDAWKGLMKSTKYSDPVQYENILIDLQATQNLSERDLFCLLYSPCYVRGWLIAAMASGVVCVLYIADIIVGSWPSEWNNAGRYMVAPHKPMSTIDRRMYEEDMAEVTI